MTEQVTPAAPAEPEGIEPEKKKGGLGKIVGIIVSVLVAVAVVAVIKFGFSEVVAFFTGDTTKAAVGDCINHAPKPEDTKIVECTAPEAADKVVGIVEDKTKAEAETICATFPTAERLLFMYEGKAATEATKGRTLCLETIQK